MYGMLECLALSVLYLFTKKLFEFLVPSLAGVNVSSFNSMRRVLVVSVVAVLPMVGYTTPLHLSDCRRG